MALSELPPPHRRAVHATLQLLDEKLDALRALLKVGAHRSVLLQMENDLTGPCQAALLDQMEALATQVAKAAQNLDLPPERMTVSRTCASRLALLWELAPDLRPG